MNKFSSKQVVLFISAVLSVIALVFWILIPKNQLFLFLSPVAVLVFFTITYFLIQTILNKYVSNKIKPICPKVE